MTDEDLIKRVERIEDSLAAAHIDLVPNEPEVIVRYVNVYSESYSYLYPNRSAADNGASTDRIACIRVEYTEGQFDD